MPGYSGDIYRLNLATNSNELFFANAGRVVGPIFCNSDQSEIFFQMRFSLMAVDAIVPSPQERQIMTGVEELVDIKDSPIMNRYYISFMNTEDSDMTVVINRTTLEPVDTIYEQDTPYTSFLSYNQDGLYRLQDDSTGIFFSEYLIKTKKQEKPRRCGSLGPFAGSPSQEDARSGYALVGYDDSLETNLVKGDFAASFMYQYYVLCNVDQNITYTPIPFPWRSRGYLSSDHNYAMLERVDYDTSISGGQYYTGRISVFNSKTGELYRQLSLPPGGRVFIFENYPEMFYYYNDSTNQAIAISDSVVTPTNALIDTLISLKHQAVANGWLRDDRNRGHDIYDMMKGNEWYKEGEFKKFGRWEVGKDWQFDHDWNEGIVEVLDRRLDMAKRSLDRGDSVMAKRNLEIFVLEVELLNNLSTRLVKRVDEPIITCQGYLSLKFNAEYVIDRLPERHSEGRGGGRTDKR